MCCRESDITAERHREGGTQRETHKGRHTKGDTQRETQRETETHRGGHTQRETHRGTHRDTQRETGRGGSPTAQRMAQAKPAERAIAEPTPVGDI